MKNLLCKIKGFWHKVWDGTCTQTKSLWQKTLAVWGRFLKWCLGIKDKLKNNTVVPTVINKAKEYGTFLDDNRKVCYPVIMLIYTVIIVVVTASVSVGIALKDEAEGEARLADNMIESAPYPATVYMTKGETLSAPGRFDLRYDDHKFDSKIVPSKAEKYGAYYENHSEGNLYFAVALTYTNRSERVVRCDETVRATAECAGVSYKSFVAVETEQGTNFEFAGDKDIAPGESVNIHCIFDVPASMRNTGHDIVVELTADGTTYYIDIK